MSTQAVTAVRPPSPVEQSILDIDAAIERLDHHAAALWDRLRSVLAEDPAQAEPAAAPQLSDVSGSRGSSELAGRQAALAGHLGSVAESLGTLMDRLEL